MLDSYYGEKMIKIMLINEDKEFECKDGNIIFDVLDGQGYQLPHGCLAGSCGACRIEICSGEENLDRPSAVESDTIKDIIPSLKRIHGSSITNTKKKIRLACRAKVNGDISIKTIK